MLRRRKQPNDLKGDAPLPLTKAQHLDPTLSPKRILSLDGGGIRGVLTLAKEQVKADHFPPVFDLR